MTVNIHEAKTHFSRLLQEIKAGQKVIISRLGEPVAELIPVKKHHTRTPGSMRGRIVISDDFDPPLDNFEKDFYQ